MPVRKNALRDPASAKLAAESEPEATPELAEALGTMNASGGASGQRRQARAESAADKSDKEWSSGGWHTEALALGGGGTVCRKNQRMPCCARAAGPSSQPAQRPEPSKERYKRYEVP